MHARGIIAGYLEMMPDYVDSFSMVQSTVYGFQNKTVVIEFRRPVNILSTLEGQRDRIRFIGNHSAPVECWGKGHENGGMDAMMEEIYRTVGLPRGESSLLFTGADVENTAASRQRYRDISLCVLATAGVKSNAIRASADEGGFYEPGTINIMILPNMRLSSRAMTGAIITATEAKTAALQDLDIRSSFSPLISQATGTGTDNIIIAAGEGGMVEYTGGHTRMGEMIARGVYDSVREAISRQNDILSGRDLTERLSERGMDLSGLISSCDMCQGEMKARLCCGLELLMRKPGHRSFIESALAISDHYEKGLVGDLSSFERWCVQMAGDIAGRDIGAMTDIIPPDAVPEPLRMAVNSLMNGIYDKIRQEGEDVVPRALREYGEA